MTPLHLERAARLEQIALGMLGSPYLWPCAANGWVVGKGQMLPDGRRSFDCSGFVVWNVLQVNPGARVNRAPLDIRFFGAHRLWCELEPVSGPGPGVAAFYGRPERVHHVVICLEDGRIVGANGGGSRCINLSESQKRKASVKLAPGPDYAPDLTGFRLLPLT